jgi:hypothetical protein
LSAADAKTPMDKKNIAEIATREKVFIHIDLNLFIKTPASAHQHYKFIFRPAAQCFAR